MVGVINSSVHIVMYGYYFLAALGPEMQKYLWWKKYITRMQMVNYFFVYSRTKYGRKLIKLCSAGAICPHHHVHGHVIAGEMRTTEIILSLRDQPSVRIFDFIRKFLHQNVHRIVEKEIDDQRRRSQRIDQSESFVAREIIRRQYFCTNYLFCCSVSAALRGKIE